MKLRYKSTGEECGSDSFNTCSLCEVLTGDDSADISSLDCFLLFSVEGLTEKERKFKEFIIKVYRSVSFNASPEHSKISRDALEVLKEHGVWKDFRQAFADRDVIPDNYNRYFGEPVSQEERDRGYSL